MGYTVSRLEAPPHLRVAVEGAVTGADLVAALGEIAAFVRDAGVHQPTDILWDTRRLTGMDAAPEDLPAIDAAIKEVDRHREQGRSAVLIEEGMVDLKLFAAMLLARRPRGNRPQAMFSDYEAALAWLAQA